MKPIRTDHIREGDLLAGTDASGNYEDGPRRVSHLVRAPEEEQRTNGTHAHRITWTDGTTTVYYADTIVLLAQRP